MKTHRLHFEILSPVHIGSGQEIDPLNYLIAGGRLCRISFDDFIAGLNDEQRTKFENLIDKGNLIDLRKFVEANINKERDTVYSVEVSQKVDGLYKAKINDIQNQLLISPFIRSEVDTIPLIPGSSIKGAIRTAVISELAAKSNLPKPKEPRDEYAFESKVLGYKDGKDDPFRGIRIRDCSLQDGDTIVREVRNISKKKGSSLQPNNIQIICEVSQSSVTGKTVEFDTEVSFDNDLYSTKFLSATITLEQVIRSCRAFYKDKMDYEHKRFYKNSEIDKISSQLLATPLDEQSFLLRLGRFSGVESVTLDNYRHPKPPGNKAIWGTSRNLVEALYPMGWVKVTVS
jgi:CRISPR-associated protein Csm5